MVSLALLGLSVGQPAADIPPEPHHDVRVLSSPGCAMRALTRAVDRRHDALIECTVGETPGDRRAQVSCSFNAAGTVVKCETLASPKPTLSKKTQTCIEGVLAALKLDPKAGDPTGCQAQIEVRYSRKKRRQHNPNRDYDPNNPLIGI